MSFQFKEHTGPELLVQAKAWVERRRNSDPKRRVEKVFENDGLPIEEHLKAFLEFAGQQPTQPHALVQWIKDALE